MYLNPRIWNDWNTVDNGIKLEVTDLINSHNYKYVVYYFQLLFVLVKAPHYIYILLRQNIDNSGTVRGDITMATTF